MDEFQNCLNTNIIVRYIVQCSAIVMYYYYNVYTSPNLASAVCSTVRVSGARQRYRRAVARGLIYIYIYLSTCWRPNDIPPGIPNHIISTAKFLLVSARVPRKVGGHKSKRVYTRTRIYNIIIYTCVCVCV